jgi:hypothetical protein
MTTQDLLDKIAQLPQRRSTFRPHTAYRTGGLTLGLPLVCFPL